ncbi:small GTP-binding protein [Histomonas meleagridis]|uniref:small GTP-binding protein n=1 Tax=Histomonas meleagridis TaxID=135588 RepID=UPI0035593EE0|nr:small GTP-binding protein [Histomonas meleagridis]KAH0805362.1 small GTP-binding protein [Histomonas meleagridis]
MKHFKVILLGSSHSGKTSIAHRYVHKSFTQNTVASTQPAFFQKEINQSGYHFILDIWDTAGQEAFHSLAPIIYRDARGALIIFDITDPSSFKTASKWVNELKQANGDMTHMILVGNKSDLASSRAVTREEAEKYAQANHFQYFETSAKTGQGIESPFFAMGRLISEDKRQDFTKGETLNKRKTNIRFDETQGQEEEGKCC